MTAESFTAEPTPVGHTIQSRIGQLILDVWCLVRDTIREPGLESWLKMIGTVLIFAAVFAAIWSVLHG